MHVDPIHIDRRALVYTSDSPTISSVPFASSALLAIRDTHSIHSASVYFIPNTPQLCGPTLSYGSLSICGVILPGL